MDRAFSASRSFPTLRQARLIRRGEPAASIPAQFLRLGRTPSKSPRINEQVTRSWEAGVGVGADCELCCRRTCHSSWQQEPYTFKFLRKAASPRQSLAPEKWTPEVVKRKENAPGAASGPARHLWGGQLCQALGDARDPAQQAHATWRRAPPPTRPLHSLPPLHSRPPTTPPSPVPGSPPLLHPSGGSPQQRVCCHRSPSRLSRPESELPTPPAPGVLPLTALCLGPRGCSDSLHAGRGRPRPLNRRRQESFATELLGPSLAILGTGPLPTVPPILADLGNRADCGAEGCTWASSDQLPQPSIQWSGGFYTLSRAAGWFFYAKGGSTQPGTCFPYSWWTWCQLVDSVRSHC